MQNVTCVLIEMPDRDVTIDIERTTSAIETTLPDMTLRIDAVGPLVQATGRQLSEQFKQDNVASRSAITRVGDSVALLSGRFDQGIVKMHENIAATSTMSVSVLRKDHAQGHARMLQELQLTRSDVSDLGDTVKRFDMALRAIPTREELGRLISKPGQLKELCDNMGGIPEGTGSRPPRFGSRSTLARRTCICRKRVQRSRQALVWGPWQASAETSTANKHFPGCVYYVKSADVLSTRWVVAFTGLRGLINRAIEVSFSSSFGAGGCSLSPGFTYYPSIDRRRDPAFRIVGLMSWAGRRIAYSPVPAQFVEFWELCMVNMVLLYRQGKVSPKAVDLYGRGVLHYFSFLRVGPPIHLATPAVD